MVLELVIRFLVGGLVVCAFAVIGDVVRPRTFAGIFGAAPSVALATLGLAFVTHSGSYASLEGRSMIVGAIGLLAYSLLVCRLLTRRTMAVLAAVTLGMVAWFAAAFSVWGAVLR